MWSQQSSQDEAARQFAEGIRLYEHGTLAEAIAALRQAVLLYAALPAEDAPLRQRADACQRFADYLVEAEEHAEAANIYQEAVDLYQQLGDESSAQEAHICAQKLLACVEALRAQPQNRLYLLIAHYERQQRQLALKAGTEREQAECCVQMARVFQRRERFFESIQRYQEALQLLEPIPSLREVQFSRAECYHRIGTMLDRIGADLKSAADHYRNAIELYAQSEEPIYGIQEARALCLRALADVECRLSARENSARPSLEE